MSRTHMDKGQKQSDLLIIFFIRKRACHICTPLCPLFRKSRYSAYHGCSKNYFVSFLLYIDLVFCFFAPEKQYSGTKKTTKLGTMVYSVGQISKTPVHDFKGCTKNLDPPKTV